MSKNIYFDELTTLKQKQILDAYGANNAAELGLDTQPYATIVYDRSGELERIELFEPAV